MKEYTIKNKKTGKKIIYIIKVSLASAILLSLPILNKCFNEPENINADETKNDKEMINVLK